MPERSEPFEKLPFNGYAKEIGAALSRIDQLDALTEIEINGLFLSRIGQTSERLKFSPSLRNKKNQFSAQIENRPVVIVFFSSQEYGEDLDYFQREYETYRDVYAGQAIAFTERKIAPALLGCDEENLTLIVEKGEGDLSTYFTSQDEVEVETVLTGVFELFKHLWETSQETNHRFPRYVEAFLKPEYPHLQGKKIEDYLTDQKAIKLYLETQRRLGEFLPQVDQPLFTRGFGFPDIKPANMVKDSQGRLVFIDPGRAAIAYHWLSNLGQFYQSASKEAHEFLFTQGLSQRIGQTIQQETNPNQAIKLFLLGRLNRLLIPLALRNLVYAAKIGLPLAASKIEKQLEEVSHLLKVSSFEEALSPYSAN